MSIWGIVWSYLKGMLSFKNSGTGGMVDYALDCVNNLLTKDNISSRISEAHKTASKVSEFLHRYEDWCPAKWKTQFGNAVAAIDCLVDTFADCQVSGEELEKVTNQFKIAYADWVSED